MRVTTKTIRNATKLEVSDGHPINNGGETVIHMRMQDGLWYCGGDTAEDPIETDEIMLNCYDVLKVWEGEVLVLDRKEEMLAKWNKQDREV